MPPHCDSLDGPVVTAARQALEAGDVAIVLPYVPADAEAEVRAAFDAALPVRGLGPQAREVAERLVFETVVRLHRAGEGAPYTGLKPAGLSHGPVIPLAERAVETGSPPLPGRPRPWPRAPRLVSRGGQDGAHSAYGEQAPACGSLAFAQDRVARRR